MIYEVWFQNSHLMMTVEAQNSQQARRIVNKQINLKKIKNE